MPLCVIYVLAILRGCGRGRTSEFLMNAGLPTGIGLQKKTTIVHEESVNAKPLNWEQRMSPDS